MIELIDVVKSYSGRQVLSGAGLTVNGGESLALVGANGSGKTTTLRCAAGLARPDRGIIRIDGIDVWTHQREARARLGYLAQRTDFPSTLTVREILRFVADLRGVSGQAVEREISLCGLTRVAGRTAAALSGGERQRVAMAAIFIPDVSTYLLDEPTLNLDPAGSRILVDRMRMLREEGRTVLFTTHVNGDVEALATRVAVMRKGRFLPVSDDCSAGERHVSMAVSGHVEHWVSPALRAGAKRAWAGHDRLHAIVNDTMLSSLLTALAQAGASISVFRTESALATALERLNDEEHHSDIGKDSRIDRCTALGGLWRHAWWAGAGSAGPR
jgi:ABC-type multidrug transport system ATPase subunit